MSFLNLATDSVAYFKWILVTFTPLVSLSLLYKMADITKEELRKEITGKLQNLCCGTVLATENIQISL